LIPWLGRDDAFPPVECALAEPNGLLAAGADLSVPRLVQAYRSGIFPWFNANQPLLWWSPDPRMVLFPDELKVSRSLGRTLRKASFELRADSAFAEVVQGCRAPRRGQDGTWISDEMAAAYLELHRAGIAHSIESWVDGELAGGLYGVALGRAFFGESMFALRTDASKVALVALVRQLRHWRFGLIDCQMNTAHLASLGAREIARADFTRRLRELVNCEPVPGPWRLDPAHIR
jgi:leucyl/phenylalanyl-tRNA--protein transferase